jgi:AcrR family transcriptional regulator
LRKPNLRPKTNARRTRRPRRSKEEIIDRLLEAAGDEFERNGYMGTKTATIARKAAVAEALIFSHFGSKAKLFHDSIFKPLDRQLQEFCATHLVEAGNTEKFRADTRQYILELHRFIGSHSKMFRSLLAAQLYATDNVQGLSDVEGLQNYFSHAVAMAMRHLRGKPRVHPKLLARISFAALLSCVIFRDWLFPEELASEDEMRDAISAFIMDGLNTNDDRRPSARRLIRSRTLPGITASRKLRATPGGV